MSAKACPARQQQTNRRPSFARRRRGEDFHVGNSISRGQQISSTPLSCRVFYPSFAFPTTCLHENNFSPHGREQGYGKGRCSCRIFHGGSASGCQAAGQAHLRTRTQAQLTKVSNKNHMSTLIYGSLSEFWGLRGLWRELKKRVRRWRG